MMPRPEEPNSSGTELWQKDEGCSSLGSSVSPHGGAWLSPGTWGASSRTRSPSASGAHAGVPLSGAHNTPRLTPNQTSCGVFFYKIPPSFSPLAPQAAQEMLGDVSPNVSSPKTSQGLGRRSPAGDTELGLTCPWPTPKQQSPQPNPAPQRPSFWLQTPKNTPKGGFPEVSQPPEELGADSTGEGLRRSPPCLSFPPPARRDPQGFGGLPPLPRPYRAGSGAPNLAWVGFGSQHRVLSGSCRDRQLLNQPLCSAALK